MGEGPKVAIPSRRTTPLFRGASLVMAHEQLFAYLVLISSNKISITQPPWGEAFTLALVVTNRSTPDHWHPLPMVLSFMPQLEMLLTVF